jgi:hypothetical protein
MIDLVLSGGVIFEVVFGRVARVRWEDTGAWLAFPIEGRRDTARNCS